MPCRWQRSTQRAGGRWRPRAQPPPWNSGCGWQQGNRRERPPAPPVGLHTTFGGTAALSFQLCTVPLCACVVRPATLPPDVPLSWPPPPAARSNRHLPAHLPDFLTGPPRVCPCCSRVDSHYLGASPSRMDPTAKPGGPGGRQPPPEGAAATSSRMGARWWWWHRRSPLLRWPTSSTRVTPGSRRCCSHHLTYVPNG
jgi:hypothetical protein